MSKNPEKPVEQREAVSAVKGKNLWTFAYKQGLAPKQGCVEAASEELGYRVACAWCEANGFRAPAKVFPMILADESILKVRVEDPVLKPIAPSGVVA